MTLDVSEVLAVYLGASATGGYQPVDCEQRLRAAHPRYVQSALPLVAKYLDCFDYPPDEWKSGDLAREQQIYAQRLANAFPELSARAINALACRWSYRWK